MNKQNLQILAPEQMQKSNEEERQKSNRNLYNLYRIPQAVNYGITRVGLCCSGIYIHHVPPTGSC